MEVPLQSQTPQVPEAATLDAIEKLVFMKIFIKEFPATEVNGCCEGAVPLPLIYLHIGSRRIS